MQDHDKKTAPELLERRIAPAALAFFEEIARNDGINLSAQNISISEGDIGVSEAVLILSLSAPSEIDVTFDFETRDGTATAGGDYIGKSGHGVFPAGTTSVGIPISILGDTLYAWHEVFYVDILNISGANGLITVGECTIFSDDYVTLDVPWTTVTEGNDGTRMLVFDVLLSGGMESEFVLTYRTQDTPSQSPWQAEPGVDFEPTSGVVTIPAGNTSGSFAVPVYSDTVVEESETVYVALTGSNLRETRGRIKNDDFLVRVYNDGRSDEGSQEYIRLWVEGGEPEQIVVNFSTLEGTALAGTDFEPLFGSVTLGHGTDSIQFVTIADSIHERDEYFFVKLSSSVPLQTDTVKITIPENDIPEIKVELALSEIIEDGSSKGAGIVPFKVSLTAPALFPVTFRLKTEFDTGGQSDIYPIDKIVTIPVGETEYKSEVKIKPDRFAEGEEYFSVSISEITDARVGYFSDAWGNFTITDNDSLKISKNKKVATWRDIDGDLVTLKVTKGVLKPDLFYFTYGNPIPGSPTVSGQYLVQFQLNEIGNFDDLETVRKSEGMSVKFTAARQGRFGDNRVNIGTIAAPDIRLRDVSVSGNLERIMVGYDPFDGDDEPSGRGIRTLNVGSMSILEPTASQTIDDTRSFVYGTFGSIKVARDFDGVSIEQPLGSTGGSVTIGGHLKGGGDDGVFLRASSLVIGGDLLGRNDADKVTVEGGSNVLKIKGKVSNAEVFLQGLKSMNVGKDWISSSLTALGPQSSALTIRGMVERSDFFASEVEQMKVIGNWTGSNLNVIGKIAKIVIGGSVNGSMAQGDVFGFNAQQIGSMTVSGKKIPLTSGQDTLIIGATEDVVVAEV